ncbi:MAG: hypothetical protein MUO51_00640 [Woeseiaceae bacterium]|nr:hypothetical protein [Woeseiaceae bacterium]
MMTQTGRDARTLTSYVDILLDYPRWIIERDVDFTDCRYQGRYTASAEVCTTCLFGDACCWLKLARTPASPDDPLPDLMNALRKAATYLQATYSENHERGCSCETCLWLRQARRFLHSQGH